MNNSRADALLQWINSVTGSKVVHLTDVATLENVEILSKVVKLIDKEHNAPFPVGTVEERICYISNYLEGIYHSINGFISCKSVAKGDELEICKLISLLLCAAVLQGNNVPYFIEKIHHLEDKVQHHLKAIIETMLYNTEKGELNAKLLTKLLQETDTCTVKDGNGFFTSQSPVFSPVPHSPAETVYSNSPFLTLMQSPQMKNKQKEFIVNKLHQKVNTLQIDLEAQHHLQTTLEFELAEKNQDIDTKNTKIRQLQKELVQVKMVVDELESLQHFKNDYEKAEKEINKLKQKVAELEDFKQQTSNLEERTEIFLKEKELFEKQVEESKVTKARLERYKQQAHHLEFQASELQAALHRREEEMEKIMKERDEALSAASESAELWRSRRLTEPEADDEAEFHQLEGSPILQEAPSINQESRLIELEFQNERLKKQLASSIEPEKLQQMKDKLEDTERSKKSYEEKYIQATSKILALDDSLAQVQDQSRIRQEALQRKLDDSNKLLNDNRGKLEESRKEIARLQSELMVSRGEVEAHVIALEKQRVTTSKAMDDMAAERKVCEEEASQKLTELRRELESREKQALTNCERLNKEYDAKLRNITEELQSIHMKDREEMQLKIQEMCKDRENLKTQFTTKEEELKMLVQKAERDTVEVRDVYENMLAEIKNELENEIQTNKELSQTLQQTCESMENRVNQLEQEKHHLIEDLEKAKENVNKLTKEYSEMNKEIERRSKAEKVWQENELMLKKEIETLKAEEVKLKDEKATLNNEILTVKESAEKILQEKSLLETAMVDAKEKENMMLEEHTLALSSLELNHATELESIIEKIEKNNQESMSKAQTINDELSKTVERSMEQVDELSREKEGMKKLIEEKVNCIEQMEEELAQVKSEKEQQIKKIQEKLVEKQNDFEKEISKLKLQNEENLKKLDEEMAKLGATSKEEINMLRTKHDEEIKSLHIDFKKKDEHYVERIAELDKENKNVIKNMNEEMKEKDEKAQQEIAQLKSQHEEVLKHLNEEISRKDEVSKREIADRNKSLEHLTESFTKQKQDTNATEKRLLEMTRERNELEKALAEETKQSNEKIEALSFQREQMKAEHTRAVQEMVNNSQEERQNHKREKRDLKDQLDKACHGLKVAADSIEDFKTRIGELEQNIVTEKSKVKTLEADVEKVKEQSKEKQKKIFDDASKKNSELEKAFETDRQNWKKKLDAASEENMAIRSEMFENAQKHSAEMMDLRRVVQEKEDKAATEERKLREEIRAFIANLANERVANNELKEKLQQTENEAREVAKTMETKDKMLNDVKDQLQHSESKEHELAQTLDLKDKELNEKCQELKDKELSNREELEKLKVDLEAEKNAIKEQFEEQIREKSKESSELQQEIKGYKEQIEHQTNEFQKERETSQEQFQKQLDEHSNSQEERLREIEQLKKEIEELKKQKDEEAEQNKSRVEEEQSALQKQITDLQKKLEETTGPLKDLETSLEAMTEERDKAISELEKAQETWNEKENQLTKVVSELEDECKILQEKEQAVVRDEEERKTIAEQMEKLEQDNTELEEILQEEKATNRRLCTQVNSLTAQVNLADRQLREQKQSMEKLQTTDAKKPRRQFVIPVENVHQLLDDDSSTDDEPLLKIEELAGGSSLSSLSSVGSDLAKSSTSLNSFSRSSLRSTFGGRSAANRRQSAIYLKGRTPPEKRTTASAAYFMVGDEFAKNMEDEPYEYNWDKLGELAEEKATDSDRLAELERRNTICKPHMKTSYPIETQTCPEENKKLVSSISESGYRTRLKRKSDESMTTEGTASKLRKDQQTSKSESSLKRSKSKKLTETVASKINALRSRSKENVSKETEKQAAAGNVAFSIDITPPTKKTKSSSKAGTLQKAESKISKENDSKAQKLSESMAFTIENSPPKNKKVASELKPKRQRTINRSTASTRLLFEKDKEVVKETKKKEYLRKSNRKPLRTANKK